MPNSSVDPQLAEALGMLLGDGCISRYVSMGRTRYEVAFTGNPSEMMYYRRFLKPALERRFSVHGRLWLRDDGTVRLHFKSVRMASYLLSLNVPLGKRSDAALPLGISGNNNLLISFIRGLYHAEGSYYHRYSKKYGGHKRVYHQEMVIQVRMKLRTLMKQVHDALKSLGLFPTRLTAKAGVFTFRITDQHEIEKFFRLIRPRLKTSK